MASLLSSRLRASRFCGCGLPHTGLSRRGLLAGGVALGAAALAPRFVAEAVAQTPAHRIDVHHHVSPPTWLDAVKSMKKDNPPMANWSVQKTLDDMDKGGVAIAMTSPTTPQTFGLDAAQAARVARDCNEYAKKLETQHPGRFGTWATLPLPHIDESLKEIAYAFDTLKVDGVGIMTSYGDKWLGYAGVRAGVGRAQPPQGHRLHAPDRRQLLRQSGERHRRGLPSNSAPTPRDRSSA